MDQDVTEPDVLTPEERQRVERVRRWVMLGEDVAQLVKLVDRLCVRLQDDRDLDGLIG